MTPLHHGETNMRMLFLSLAALVVGCAHSIGDDSGSNEPGPTDENAPEEFTKTASGLEYRILRKGNGVKPAPTDTVEVHYKGWLDDGTVFDSSYKRGKTTSFPLNRVIGGWTEGLQLVDENGMIELAIPPELGYGANGIPGTIPPNAKLHFLVELKNVK